MSPQQSTYTSFNDYQLWDVTFGLTVKSAAKANYYLIDEEENNFKLGKNTTKHTT